ncbi:type IV pilus modification protein PilV [uncultured Tolumonas sp.]|uniref:type IV pilus modification protein PilV n=1 Tax=uncultured Tolumonas sp. TaxID=263765 RepID=UPI0029305178|nr:type IV pilus modification protein PilV [uncultured Tolumonas sp.]
MSHKNRWQHGFSLIEVLISLVLLGVGLLGAIALQATSLKEGQVSNYRSNATVIAHSVLDQVRANSMNAASYQIALGDLAPVGTSVVQRDLQTFKNTASTLLPNGNGSIDVTPATRHVTITLHWSEDRVANGESTQEFQYASEY